MEKNKRKKKSVQKPGKLMLNNPIIPPELDEDIDDDMAFDSDDEKMYGHLFNKGNKKKNQEGSLDDFQEGDEAMDDDDDGEGAYDLSDLLDENLKAENTKKEKPKKNKKRSRVELTREDESIFGLSGSSVGETSSYSSALRSLLRKPELDEKEKEAVDRLKKTLASKKKIIAIDEDDSTKAKLDREQARKVVEENMKKYKPVIREINTSKHITFPMRQPNSVPVSTSIGALASLATESLTKDEKLDNGIGALAKKLAVKTHSILADAGLRQKEIDSQSKRGQHIGVDEQIMLGDHSLDDENSISHGYVAKLKSMLAAENSRRKRFNKIKSKTYRRILRKEKDREKEKKEKAFELLHPELARKRLSEKLMKARAEERVTQKHKNTSVWVKKAKRFAKFDENTKGSINEQLRLHQQLMQKMDEEAGDEYYENVSDEDKDQRDDDEEEMLVDTIVSSADMKAKKEAMKSLWDAMSENEKNNSDDPFAKARSELKNMKFMKDAKEREKRQMLEELEALAKDVNEHENGSEVLESKDSSAESKINRMRLSPSKNKRDGVESGNDRLENIQLLQKKGITWDSDLKGEDQNLNDYLASNFADNSLKKESSEFAGNRKKAAQTSSSTPKSKTLRPTIVDSKQERVSMGEESPKVHDIADAELRNQSYLVSRAFAEDQVDEDFLKKKTEQVDAVLEPVDRNASLPGWGEWGGDDPNLNKRHKEKVAHTLLQKEIEKSFLLKSRADAALDHVIINHDGVELVPDRMTLHMVPRPFSNPQEFARSMRQPVGPEWSTSISFKEGVQPRVEVHQGQSVLPLDVSLRSKKTKTKRRKVEK